MNGSGADDLLIEQYHDYVYSLSEKYYASITFCNYSAKVHTLEWIS